MTVAILGAGVTGLATAHQLLKAGCEVTVYEASSGEGGLGATFRRGDFAFDFGPHEFCTENPALVDLLAEVCGDDLLRVRRRTAQHFRGRMVRYPFEIVDVLKNVGPRLTARAVAEVSWQRLTAAFRRARPETFESWTVGRFGRTLYDEYFGPYTQKVWGVEPNRLDASTAADRIATDSVWQLLWKTLRYNVLGGEDVRRQHSEYRKTFLYTRGGIGTLQGHLRREVEALGGRFEFGKRLDSVRRDGDRITELGFADGTSANGFETVVSTIPLPLMVRLCLGDDATALLAENDLPFRGMVFLFLSLRRPQASEFQWVYFPEPQIPFQRITEFTHFGAGMAPPGCSGLTLEIATQPSEPLWQMSDRELTSTVVGHLKQLGMCTDDDVIGGDVVRVRHAYPIQLRGFRERAHRLLEALSDRATNVVSIGRQGLFRYCNMNECIEMAIDMAPAVAAGLDGVRYEREGTWRGVHHVG